MPRLNDRQRHAIQALTDRQLEALSQAALGKHARSRWDGRGIRSNMGGASSRMVEGLRTNGLLDREFYITFAGVEGVLLNIARVPELRRAEVKAAAARLKPELEVAEDRAAEAAEALRVQREEAAVQRKNERNDAILEKLPKLAAEHGLVISDDSGKPEPSRGQLIAFWEAIASADMML